MNEFIVWDKKAKKFDKLNNTTWVEFCNYTNPCLVNSGALGYERISTEDISIHQYIRKKDIEGNKIYTDCSIFEFILETPSVESQSMCYKTLRGSLTFNDEDLRYEIDIYGDSEYCVLWYSSEFMYDFKVIDTIQENKLGLIKKGD